jgi:hypothetical protein
MEWIQRDGEHGRMKQNARKEQLHFDRSPITWSDYSVVGIKNNKTAFKLHCLLPRILHVLSGRRIMVSRESVPVARYHFYEQLIIVKKEDIHHLRTLSRRMSECHRYCMMTFSLGTASLHHVLHWNQSSLPTSLLQEYTSSSPKLWRILFILLTPNFSYIRGPGAERVFRGIPQVGIWKDNRDALRRETWVFWQDTRPMSGILVVAPDKHLCMKGRHSFTRRWSTSCITHSHQSRNRTREHFHH